MAEVCAVGQRQREGDRFGHNAENIGSGNDVAFKPSIINQENIMFSNLTLIVTIGTGAGGSVRATSTASGPAPTSRALMEIDCRRRRRDHNINGCKTCPLVRQKSEGRRSYLLGCRGLCNILRINVEEANVVWANAALTQSSEE